VSVAVALLAVYLLRIESGAPTREARASAFVTLLVGEILLVLVVRAHAEPFWRVGARGNRSLWWVLAATIAMAVAVLVVPDARHLLRLGPLGAADVAIAAVAAVLATAWTSLVAVTRGRKSLRGRTVAPTSGGPAPARSAENR
jgi:Ca2+-transporting ATPase